jgi:hypothetical protein
LNNSAIVFFPAEENDRFGDFIISRGCTQYGEYICNSKVKNDNKISENEEYCILNDNIGSCSLYKEEENTADKSKPKAESKKKAQVWLFVVIGISTALVILIALGMSFAFLLLCIFFNIFFFFFFFLILFIIYLNESHIDFFF